MTIGTERLSFFRGGLRFGGHAVDNTADIPAMAHDLAGDIEMTFQKRARNCALLEVANLPSNATSRHRLFYSQYPSHPMAFAAVTLEHYGKRINRKGIDQILDIYRNRHDPPLNFILSYLQSLDLLTRHGFRVAVVYEDNQISSQVIAKQAQKHQHRYQAISTREEFRAYFDDYVRDIITVRDTHFARIINDLARGAEASRTLTILFGFLGLSHKRGVIERLENGVREVVTVREIEHGYTQVKLSLEDLIKLRVAYGYSISDQEWTDYYTYYLTHRRQHR